MGKLNKVKGNTYSVSAIREAIYDVAVIDGSRMNLTLRVGEHVFATKDCASKVYVLQDGPEVIYIGSTRGTLAKEVNEALRGRMERIAARSSLILHAFFLEPVRTGLMPVFVDERALNAIVAELVYTYRGESGKWPVLQNAVVLEDAEGLVPDVIKELIVRWKKQEAQIVH